MWYTKFVKNFHYSVQICHSRCFVMFLASCPCTKNTEITVFLVKRKGLLRLRTNPSVRSFYNPFQVEYESISTGIVGMVYLVHWSILYRSSGGSPANVRVGGYPAPCVNYPIAFHKTAVFGNFFG